MVDRVVVEDSMQICLSAWKTDVNTIKDAWFEKLDRWLHILGLPCHLRPKENLVKIGDPIRRMVVVDVCSVSLANLNSGNVTWRTVALPCVA